MLTVVHGALQLFYRIPAAVCCSICMEDIEGTILNDTQARQVIENVLQEMSVNILQEMSKTDRNAVLNQLKQEEGLSIRQISRLTGMSFNIVKRA